MNSVPGTSLPPGCDLDPADMDPEIWATCAGPLLTVPAPNSIAVYCPQGHAEHVSSAEEAAATAGTIPHPSQIICRVIRVTAEAHRAREDLSLRLHLQPLSAEHLPTVQESWAAAVPLSAADEEWPPRQWGNPNAVWKVLSRSDALPQGGLSLPKQAATQCFAPLDMNQETPQQQVLATDLFMKSWHFRHVFRGAPKRHLLSTNWNRFLLEKTLVESDRVVFIRGFAGSIKIGIRRSTASESDGRGALSCSDVFQQAAQVVEMNKSFEVTYHIRPRICGNPIFVVPLDMFCRTLKQIVVMRPNQKVKFALECPDFGIKRLTGKARPVVVSSELRQSLLSESLDLRRLTALWRCVEVEWKETDHQQAGVELPTLVSPWEIIPMDTRRGGGLFRGDTREYSPISPVPPSTVQGVGTQWDSLAATGGMMSAREAHRIVDYQELGNSTRAPGPGASSRTQVRELVRVTGARAVPTRNIAPHRAIVEPNDWDQQEGSWRMERQEHAPGLRRSASEKDKPSGKRTASMDLTSLRFPASLLPVHEAGGQPSESQGEQGCSPLSQDIGTHSQRAASWSSLGLGTPTPLHDHFTRPRIHQGFVPPQTTPGYQRGDLNSSWPLNTPHSGGRGGDGDVHVPMEGVMGGEMVPQHPLEKSERARVDSSGISDQKMESIAAGFLDSRWTLNAASLSKPPVEDPKDPGVSECAVRATQGFRSSVSQGAVQSDSYNIGVPSHSVPAACVEQSAPLTLLSIRPMMDEHRQDQTVHSEPWAGHNRSAYLRSMSATELGADMTSTPPMSSDGEGNSSLGRGHGSHVAEDQPPIQSETLQNDQTFDFLSSFGGSM